MVGKWLLWTVPALCAMERPTYEIRPNAPVRRFERCRDKLFESVVPSAGHNRRVLRAARSRWTRS